MHSNFHTTRLGLTLAGCRNLFHLCCKRRRYCDWGIKLKIFDFDLGGPRGALPTAVAIADNGDRPPLFGHDAFQAPGGYSLITNWKLLLGKTELQLRTERSENASLDRVLQNESLEGIAFKYFSFLIDKLKKSDQFTKSPEFIIGIPSANVESDAARRRFRRVIEGAFAKMKAPKPHFFPEPFAVFQYHWFSGDLEDLGRPQNVMIVDIGGGTTNVCIIQTSGHGRLARGGDNHKPHGVATFERGGSSIDGLILSRIVRSTRIREAAKAYQSARLAKEKIASQLNARSFWLDQNEAAKITETVSVEGQGDWVLSRTSFCIDSSLMLSKSSRARGPLISKLRLPYVIFAVSPAIRIHAA